MKPFANIPGVIYPPDSAPEATIDRSSAYIPVRRDSARYNSHPYQRHYEVDGRNVSARWLARNRLCIRVIDGVKTVVPK